MIRIVPVTFREASAFVAKYHRHNKPPRGCKFCVGVVDETGLLRGVAQAGRPIARLLDDGLVLEVNRTCTDGCPNANSMLYGACRTIAKAMGYRAIITYTQVNESGASLRAAGFVKVCNLKPHGTRSKTARDRSSTSAWRERTRSERSLWKIEFGGAT